MRFLSIGVLLTLYLVAAPTAQGAENNGVQVCKRDPSSAHGPVVSFSLKGEPCILEIEKGLMRGGNTVTLFHSKDGYYLLVVRNFFDMERPQKATLVFPGSQRVEEGSAYVCWGHVGRYIRWRTRALGNKGAAAGCKGGGKQETKAE